jgi:PAS domain S-box-containing protein
MTPSGESDPIRSLIEQEHARIMAHLLGPAGEAPPDPRAAEHYLTLIRGIAALTPAQLGKLQLVPESIAASEDEPGPAEGDLALAESAEDLGLFRQVAAASGHGFAVADGRGELTYANPVLCRLYGEAEPGAVMGRPMTVYLPDEWHLLFRTEIIPTVLREGCWVGELPVRSRQGDVTPAIQSIFVVHRGPAGMLRIGTRVVDISERRRMEVRLRESEERYRELVETIDEAILALDPNGLVAYVSPAIERLTGYRPAEIVGRPTLDFVSEGDRPILIERFRRLISGERLGPHEYRVIHKDGNLRWARISTAPVWREGRVIELRGTIVDIHASRETEQALRESEAMYAALVKQAEIGVAIVQDGLVKYCNTYCGRLTGLAPEAMIGRPLMEFVSPDDRATQAEIHGRHMVGDAEPRRYRAVGRRPDGSLIKVENSTVLIQYQGRPAALAVIRDVTNEPPAPGAGASPAAG